MKADIFSITVNNIKLPIDASEQEAFSVAEKKLQKLGIKVQSPEFSLAKRSIDARNKNEISFVYSINVEGFMALPNEDLLKKNSITLQRHEPLKVEYGSEECTAPPLVVGSGPCGMFCALLLAECGYKPILIERGASVEERTLAVERLHKFGIFDADTNIQFGAGGAGTFSDGKLITRINDPLTRYVLEKLVEFGAPKEILHNARPHVGTDILSVIVKTILTRIVDLGGKVLYHTRLIEINSDVSGKVYSVKTNNSDINCSQLILAIGHSARDTYKYLINQGFSLEAKPFSVGMRIEHLAMDIDKAMYGDMAGSPLLPHAEYNLSYNTKQRGVYTFCMCPGGEVVAATSEEYGTVTNGMSCHSRDGLNSNSAIVCSIFKEDYGNNPMRAMEFQCNIEKAAYIAGGKNYSAPIITVGDFLSGKLTNEPKRVIPTYRSGDAVKIADPNTYLPDTVCSGIKNALIDFNRKIEGFSAPDAVLTGAETRTSAPIRILRDNDTRLAIGYNNLYPAGEGAGYAGGITSAAIDGIKTALKIISRYKPF